MSQTEERMKPTLTPEVHYDLAQQSIFLHKLQLERINDIKAIKTNMCIKFLNNQSNTADALKHIICSEQYWSAQENEILMTMSTYQKRVAKQGEQQLLNTIYNELNHLRNKINKIYNN